MPYCVMITFTFQSIANAIFIAWLWWKLYDKRRDLIEYPVAYPTAPEYKENERIHNIREKNETKNNVFSSS